MDMFEHPKKPQFPDDLYRGIDPRVAEALGKIPDGIPLTADDGEFLFGTAGDDLAAVIRGADLLRDQAVGNRVSYVVNRNINYTNVCVSNCTFCAFQRKPNDTDTYTFSLPQILSKTAEAVEMGATEVCIQAGLNPEVDGFFPAEICRAVKREFPWIHIHAFSPEEIRFCLRKTKWKLGDYLSLLKDSGLDTMPGTAAEILDDKIRKTISSNRISSGEWVEVLSAAHRLGIRSTSTIMYGQMETPRHRVNHLLLLKNTQRETGGFTEFIPLAFIPYLTALHLTMGVGGKLTREDHLKMHAVARLILFPEFRNIQASWVKLGPQMAAECLSAGVNDFGGTLIEENISRMAGSRNGQYLAPQRMVELIEGQGKIPYQRNTLYQPIPADHPSRSALPTRVAPGPIQEKPADYPAQSALPTPSTV